MQSMTKDEFRRARLDLGLSRKELAERLGHSSRVAISSWETGREPVPRMVAALMTAFALGFNVSVEKRKPKLEAD